MNKTVSILLVADDRTFLSQVQRSSEKAGQLGGQGLVNRLQASAASGLQNWKIPVGRSVGETIGRDIGADIGEIIPDIVAKKQINYKKRGEQEKAKEAAKKNKRGAIGNSLLDSFGITKPVPSLKPLVPVKELPDPLGRQVIQKNTKSRKGTLGNSLLENFGLSVPRVKPIPTTGDVLDRLDPFKIINGEQDLRQDPVVKKALEQRAKTEKQAQQRKEAEQRSKNKINEAGQRVRQEKLEEAEVRSGDNFGYQAKKQSINDRYGNKQTENLQLIEKLKFDRQQKLNLGGDTGAGVDYTNQIKGIQAVMAENEKLRQSELQVLEVQKLQNDVIAKRKSTDQGIAATRDRRDQALADTASNKVVGLENKKVGLTDKVSIAAVEQEISNARSEAKKIKEVNSINDALADLRTNQNRKAENGRIGINNPKLNAINFDGERLALVSRKRNVESNYQQQKVTSEDNFQATVTDQNKKSRQLVDKEAQKLKIESLKAQLANTTDEQLKVKLQLEIDLNKLADNFDNIKNPLQEALNTLQQRQNTLASNGVINPELNKLISDVEKLIAQADKNKDDNLGKLAGQALLKAALAESSEVRQATSTNSLLYTPGLALAEQQSKDLFSQGQFLAASVPGRAAAIGQENLRYNTQKSEFNFQVAKTRASGIDVPQDRVDQANSSIDRLRDINLSNITAQFDSMANSINASTLALRNLAQSETQGFLTQLISGTKSFDEIWKNTLNNIVQGMIKILAQKFTEQLFDGGGAKGSGGGVLGGVFNFIGGILGFDDGGVIPGGQGHEGLGRGSNPLAAAIRREGQGATVIVGKAGERILNLPETAAYHQKYPNGILNYDRGGVIGGGSGFTPSFSGLGGGLSGNFDVNLKSEGKSQPAVNEQLSSKVTQAMRGVIANEIREGGILYRFAR